MKIWYRVFVKIDFLVKIEREGAFSDLSQTSYFLLYLSLQMLRGSQPRSSPKIWASYVWFVHSTHLNVPDNTPIQMHRGQMNFLISIADKLLLI